MHSEAFVFFPTYSSWAPMVFLNSPNFKKSIVLQLCGRGKGKKPFPLQLSINNALCTKSSQDYSYCSMLVISANVFSW